MPRFRFRSMDKKGQVNEGSANAANLAALTELLRQEGQFLISAAAQAEKLPAAPTPAPAPRRAPPRSRRGAVRDEDVAAFNGQLALMLRSAVPLLDALGTLAQQQSHAAFRAALMDITETVKGGGSLQAAFGRHSAIFDPVYLSLIEAGEASGTLPRMIDRISEYLEFKVMVRARVKSATIYPAIVMGTAFLVVAALLVFVMPVFREVFEQFDADLPPSTRLLLGVSQSLRSHALAWFGSAAASVWALRRWMRAERNRAALDRWALVLPVMGPLVKAIALARSTRTLGELLKAGVPVLKAIELTESTAGNEVFASLFRRMKEEVAGGQPLWTTLSSSEHVPEIVAHMVASGERAGRLPDALSFIAEFYQRQIDTALRDLLAALEPVFVVVLGLTIGGIAVSMLLPIFRLGGIVQ